jgi:hypothetical protein
MNIVSVFGLLLEGVIQAFKSDFKICSDETIFER